MVIFICVVLFSIIGFHYYKDYQQKKHREYLWEQFDERTDAYIRLLPEKFPELCEDLPVQGTVTAIVINSSLEEKELYYEYTKDCVFTIETGASFDDYSIKKQQEFLKKWWFCANRAERAFREKYLSEYDACMSELCSIFDNPDKSLWMRGKNNYCISTPDHLYRYTGLDNYINIDNKEIYIKKENKTNSSAGSSKPNAGKTSSSTGTGGWKTYNSDDDYYGAGDYIDADDFASDWEDSGDFEDYDDAYDYYEEVMGHD